MQLPSDLITGCNLAGVTSREVCTSSSTAAVGLFMGEDINIYIVIRGLVCKWGYGPMVQWRVGIWIGVVQR